MVLNSIFEECDININLKLTVRGFYINSIRSDLERDF